MAVSRCLTSVELFAEDIVARMSVRLHLDQENVGCKIACIAMQDRAYAFHRPGADGQSGPQTERLFRCNQYSSASMMVMTRLVTAGSDGSGERTKFAL
jgi:hypothetical protein